MENMMKFDIQSVMQQAQKMQQEMERIKEELKTKEVTADAGGGMVTVTVNGAHEITKLKIAKEIVDPEDIEMLEDLIVAAMNKAKKDADAMVEQEMGQINNMMPNIPGLNF